MQKIIRYFSNSDLRSGHLGLAKIARNYKVDPRGLGAGEYLVFVNRAKTKVKVYTGGNIIAFLSSKTRIDLRTIALIPKYFDGGEIKYSQALEEVIKKDLGITNQIKLPMKTVNNKIWGELRV
jgi:hypothetical protein